MNSTAINFTLDCSFSPLITTVKERISSKCASVEYIDEFSRHTYPHLNVYVLSLVNFFKIMGRTVMEVQFTEDARYLPSRMNTV